MQKALTYLQVELRDPSEPQVSTAQWDINSMTPLSYRLRGIRQNTGGFSWENTQNESDP